MLAPYRIKTPVRQQTATDGTLAAPLSTRQTNENLRLYFDRLLRMIPGEVVALYLVGSGIIPGDLAWVHFLWIAVCLLGLLALRAWGSSDPDEGEPPQTASVAISALAFLIWVYTLGGPFVTIGIHVPFVGSLLVLAWTFFIPLFYRG